MMEKTGQLDGGLNAHGEFNVAQHVMKTRLPWIRRELGWMGVSDDLNRPVDLLEIRGGQGLIWEFKEMKWEKEHQRSLDSRKSVAILTYAAVQAQHDLEVLTAAAKAGALSTNYFIGPLDVASSTNQMYSWNKLTFALGHDFPSDSFFNEEGKQIVFEQADPVLYPGVVQVWAIDQKKDPKEVVKILTAAGASIATIEAARRAAELAAGLTKTPPLAGATTCIPFSILPYAYFCAALPFLKCEGFRDGVPESLLEG